MSASGGLPLGVSARIGASAPISVFVQISVLVRISVFAWIGVCALIGTCALIGACASSPIRLYTLMPSEPVSATTQLPGRYRVVLTPVALPEAIDRPQLVVRVGPNRVAALEQERWAEPLHEAVPRVIRECLSSQMPDATVLLGGEDANTKADLVVALELVRVESIPGDRVLIEARGWLTARSEAEPRWFHTLVNASVRGERSDYGALVAAHAAALAQLSAELAREITSARTAAH